MFTFTKKKRRTLVEPIWRKLNLMQILNRRDNTVWKIKNFSATQILREIVEKCEPLIVSFWNWNLAEIDFT